MGKKKIVVAVTGASGAIYAKLILKKLKQIEEQLKEVSVVFSKNAPEIWEHELGETPVISFKTYERNNFYAPFASGSSCCDVMIICPCSMGTLGRIAHGISDDLITRAADVVLKERRKLILVPREMPFSLIHLENMKLITLAGGIVCPAIPSFYGSPASVEDLAMTVVDRVMDIAGFDVDSKRWGEHGIKE